MGKPKVKPNYRRRSLRLPDLDHCKRAVLNSLGSPASRRVYEYAIDQELSATGATRVDFGGRRVGWRVTCGIHVATFVFRCCS